MNRDQAIAEALATAKKQRVAMIVCNDPIANAEEVEHGRGAWGYCPRAGADLLFKHREKADSVHIEADGFTYTEAELREWGRAAGATLN